ncbi:MAG: hypothetical protein AAGD35_06145 [Actinomycetota bacterium]
MAADTTIDVARRQRAVYAAKTGEERAAMALEMSQLVRELAMEGIRRRYPGIDPDETMLRLIERCHGKALADEIEASLAARNGR